MTSRSGPAVALALACLALAACSNESDSDTAAASPTSSSPTQSSSPSPTEPAGPDQLPTYHDGDPQPIPAGTYVTASDGFFPGLKLTIPAGWTATEADSGEIGLHPADAPDNGLYVWKDMKAVITHNRDKKVGQVDKSVGDTAEELIHWLTTTSDFRILASPTPVSLGPSVKGTQVTLDISDTANFAWNDCPVNPRCAAIFTDPLHWGDGFYAIGGPEVAQISIGTVHYPDGDHTLFVTLDCPNPAALKKFAPHAEAIIKTLKPPAKYTQN